MSKKRIAIIGSGASGISAVKCCLDEGLEPVCFERTNHVGGLWYYTKEVTDGQSCVMKSTVINTSKEIMTYSDFPIPAEFPVFMHNTKVQEYLEMYAKHFNTCKYTRFNTEILSVKQTEDFTKTGQWQVKVKDKSKDAETTEVYDGVMVCTGHHAEKNIPKFEGIDTFQGKIVHTHDYRDHVGFEDKKVVVIGIGNSGGDVAVELSRIAKNVYLSTRRGTWVIHRIDTSGQPTDLRNIRRITTGLQDTLPRPLVNMIARNKLNSRVNHKNYGIQPKHNPDSQHPMVNDMLPNCIASGTVVIKPNIRRFLPTAVEFEDGTKIEDVDAIILATGFKFGFPFVEHPALEVKNNEVKLYKYVFPPDIQPGTLAVIGCIQPLGAIMPISEIQCRWAARVFKGAAPLPTPETMWADIKKKQDDMRERYVHSQRHTIQVDYVPIMDEIAEHINCKPDLRQMMWDDPVLAWKCFFGPFSPYQYRIQGPNSWPGARQAIMTIWDRTLAATKGPMADDSTQIPNYIYIVAVFILAWLIKWFINILL